MDSDSTVPDVNLCIFIPRVHCRVVSQNRDSKNIEVNLSLILRRCFSVHQVCLV